MRQPISTRTQRQGTVPPPPRARAKLFRNGGSQAVRLPKEFRFQTDEVVVKRASGGVLLLPKRITLEQLDSILEAFRGRFVRRQPRMQKRSWR